MATQLTVNGSDNDGYLAWQKLSKLAFPIDPERLPPINFRYGLAFERSG